MSWAGRRVRRGALLAILLLVTHRQALGQTSQTAQTPLANGQAPRVVAPLGEHTAAEKSLTAAYRQTPNVELLFQLGRLAAAQGELLLAQDLMRRYVNDPAAAPEPGKLAEAQQILSHPRPPSGKILVRGERGGLVLLDGRLRGRLPLVQPLLAAPGLRTVAIQYPGKLLDVQVAVVAGRMVDIQCTRATGAIFVAMPPALLLIAALPELPSALSEQLMDAVERAAQGRQLTILKSEALLTLSPELKNLPESKAKAELGRCLSQPECLQRLLHQVQLDYALRLSVTNPDAPAANAAAGENQAPDPAAAPTPKSWEFSTELVHVSILGVASAQTQRCATCTAQSAAAALQETVSRTLASGLARRPGTLTVSADPAGAEVWLGERLLGQTPLHIPTWPGEYTLELRQPGYTSVRRTLGVEAGKTAAVTASLLAVDTPPSPPAVALVIPPPVVPPLAPLRWERAPRPRWRLAVGATSVLVGASVTLLGILTMKLSADKYCPPQPDPMGPQPGCDMNDLALQRNLGIGATAVGSTILVTGVGLLVWPGPWRQVR